jgi:hypothetical protein
MSLDSINLELWFLGGRKLAAVKYKTVVRKPPPKIADQEVSNPNPEQILKAVASYLDSCLLPSGQS